ncbi:MAG: zinc ABC transporter substrate-binding protein [Firmicutes bacterium]|nr:zinc ABC transporter substrate-binding protein [Bacillota bacterium]
MKKYKYGFLALCLLVLFFATSCSFKTDNLEDATIYTTVYPINFLTNYLYKDYATISSIYPLDCDISTYELTDKQVKNYAKGDLFIYNGLTSEKETAKTLLNKNQNLLIIDVSYGLTLNYAPEELWLSPNNYLMLAKNIKDNLQEYLTSKIIIEKIDDNYKIFQEQISLMDASLHSLGKNASENNKNIIVTSSNMFKYLENYGFSVISLQDENNLKENKLDAIKSNFKTGKYTYILVADTDEDNEIIKDLTTNYKAKSIIVDTLTMSLTGDYFDVMTKYIENIKTIVS